MSLYEILTLLLSTLAVVVATVALRRGRRTAQEHLELQRTTAQLAKKQLELLLTEEETAVSPRVSLDILPYTNHHRFVLSNNGGSAARQVWFELTPHAKGSNPLIESDYEEKIPVPVLEPGAEVGVSASFSMGSATSFDVILRWQDQNGEEVEQTTFVSL